MKSKLQFIGKIIFPVFFILCGIILLFLGIKENQSMYFIVGAGMLTVIGFMSLLFFFDNIAKEKFFKISLFVTIPLVAIGAWFSYQSVNETLEFNVQTHKRDLVVIERLKDIRTAQFMYKAANDTFAPNFDLLIKFINSGKIRAIKAIGTVPDSLLAGGKTVKQAEALALKLGIIKRDTFLIDVLDTITKVVITPLDSLRYIPFSGGKEFTLNAAKLDQGRVKIPVFEATAPLFDIYKGMDETMIRNKVKTEDKDALKVGDMTKPSTSGNWE